MQTVSVWYCALQTQKENAVSTYRTRMQHTCERTAAPCKHYWTISLQTLLICVLFACRGKHRSPPCANQYSCRPHILQAGHRVLTTTAAWLDPGRAPRPAGRGSLNRPAARSRTWGPPQRKGYCFTPGKPRSPATAARSWRPCGPWGEGELLPTGSRIHSPGSPHRVGPHRPCRPGDSPGNCGCTRSSGRRGCDGTLLPVHTAAAPRGADPCVR